MDDFPGDQMIYLPGSILDELGGLRQDLQQFTGYVTQGMRETVREITGSLGYTIDDLHSQLTDIAGTLQLIDMNTSK